MSVRTLELAGDMEHALRAGHPWIYRDHIPRGFAAASGSWLRVRAGESLAWGLWSSESAIALRIFSTRNRPNAAWVRARLQDALSLRRLALSEDTTAFRLLFGEGDGVPGVTVDIYGKHAVIASYADGLDEVVRWVELGIADLLAPVSVAHKRHDQARGEDELLRGKSLPRDLVVLENGIRFRVNLEQAQKTGLFLDHRDNRSVVARFAGGRNVLNLFSYTGAFSVYAARSGARHVTTVDVAPGVVEAARENFRLNGLDPDTHKFVVADAFEWTKSARQDGCRWDLIVCDPPSFARRRQHRSQALKAYRKLNSSVLRLTELGGFLATASCTAQVEPAAFQRVVAEAALRARRRFQIFGDAGHACDHPLLAQHPEGRYLKFLFGRVLKTP